MWLGDDSVANKQVAAALHMERQARESRGVAEGAPAQDLTFVHGPGAGVAQVRERMGLLP